MAMRAEQRIEFLRQALYDIASRAGGFLPKQPEAIADWGDPRSKTIDQIRLRASVALLDDEKRLRS